MLFRVRALSCFLIALFVPAVAALAQSTFGSITGVVTDTTGAVVPNAAIEVKNQDTGVVKSLTSNAVGVYEATHLNAGRYTVTAEAAGFKKSEHRDIVLEALRQVRIDVRLEVGAVGSEVTVSAGTPVIETESATIADVKTALEIRDLPLNVLDGMVLNALLYMTPTGYQTAGSKFSFGGARGTQLYYNIDGISANSPAFGVQNLPAEPSMESIQEMRFDIVDNKAEFGQVTSVTAITKSGGNEMHGRLFWQNTNSALTARSFFSVAKGRQTLNDFGASIGGPIVRNKLFYFGTYEAFRRRIPAYLAPSVPTVKMRGGDFSELLAWAKPIVIRDPATNQPFPNNLIPTSMLNTSALKWQERFFPLPNYGPPDLPISNFRATYPQQQTQDQFDIRVDSTSRRRTRFSPAPATSGSRLT